MTIKHIVICGGGPTGFLSYGALKRLHEKEIWNKKDIETIYGSSIGGVMGVLINLAHSWEALSDYLIKRPWIKVFDKISADLLDFIENKGIDGLELAKIVLEPLLKARDLTIDATLKDLYELTKIKLVLTATNVNGPGKRLNAELLHYKNNPEMKIYEAMAITSALPMSFRPVYYKEGCYIDGGFMHNYPVTRCLEVETPDETEILAINNKWDVVYPVLNSDTSILEYLKVFTRRVHNTVDSSVDQPKVTNEVVCDASGLSDMNVWIDAFNNAEMREKLINRGRDSADKWLESRNIDIE